MATAYSTMCGSPERAYFAIPVVALCAPLAFGAVEQDAKHAGVVGSSPLGVRLSYHSTTPSRSYGADSLAVERMPRSGPMPLSKCTLECPP
jgi:hypothetical protein